MRNVILILLCFFSISVCAQTPGRWINSNAYGVEMNRGDALNYFKLPVGDTIANTNRDSLGAIIFRPQDNTVYVKKPGRWEAIAKGGDYLQNGINNSVVNVSKNTNGTLAYVGASLEEGAGGTGSIGWVDLLSSKLQALTGSATSEIGVGEFTFASIYGLTLSGTYSIVSTGPTGQAVQLTPGASIQFTGAYDYVDFFYKRASGSGFIDIYRNGSLYRTINTAGTGANICTYDSTVRTPASASASYELRCRGSNVTITTLYRLKQGTYPQLLFQRSAMGGYSTNTFLPYLYDLKNVVGPDTTGLKTFLINLGTNDIYSTGSYTSSNAFRANLINIFSYLRDSTHTIVYIFPPKASSTYAYGEIVEPYNNYYIKAKQVCDSMGIQLIDFSKYNFPALKYYAADGLHPNDAGYAFMADVILQNMAYPQPFTVPSAATVETLQSVTDRGNIVMKDGLAIALRRATSGGSTYLNWQDETGTQVAFMGIFSGNLYINTTAATNYNATSHNFNSQIKVSNGGTNGFVTLNPGDGSNSGWIGFSRPGDGAGLGFIGLSGGNMRYVSVPANGSNHIFEGGNVSIDNSYPTSKFVVNGSVALNPLGIDANVTLDATHFCIGADVTTNRTITLPDASTCIGRIYVIKKVSNNAATVAVTPASGQQIDGGGTYTLTIWNQAITIISSGTGWWIISKI